LPKRKKNHHPGKKLIAPGIEGNLIGKAFTRRYKIKATSIEAAKNYDEQRYGGPSQGNLFDRTLAPAEDSCRRILKRAGLPTDPKGYYLIPEGEKIPFPENLEEVKKALSRSSQNQAGGLTDLIKARGFREREHQEWYAGQILTLARNVRANAGKGEPWTMLSVALQIGELIGEAKGLGYFGRTFEEKGSEGGRAKRWTLPVSDLIRSLIRKNPRGTTAVDLWNMIPADSIDGIRIKECKFYRNGGRLLALGQVDGCKDWRPVGKPLGFPAFQKRVGAVRHTKTR